MWQLVLEVDIIGLLRMVPKPLIAYMINLFPTRNPLYFLAILFLPLFFSCLGEQSGEDVTVMLSKLPSTSDSVVVKALDPSDTSKVLGILYQGPWVSGTSKTLSLGGAQGKDWVLRVEGYQGGYLIYLVLIPSNKDGGSDTALHIDVRANLPAVFFTSLAREPDSVKIGTEFRLKPAGAHWHLNFVTCKKDYLISFLPDLAVDTSLLGGNNCALLVADLRLESHKPFPVQLPDTLLVKEALAPAAAGVQVIDAYRVLDTVYLAVSVVNFKLPLVDEPTPGQGIPMVYDANRFRLLPEFKLVPGKSWQMVGLASSLMNVSKLVVALHYANKMRIRPLVADTLDAALALRAKTELPTLRVLSHTVKGSNLDLVLERTHFTNMHCHIYRNQLGASDYQICTTDSCSVEASIWQGATSLVLAAHLDQTHLLFKPVVKDSLPLP